MLLCWKEAGLLSIESTGSANADCSTWEVSNSVQSMRNPALRASTMRSWHFQPLLSLAVSGVCLMQDEGQKTSVETLAGLPRCLRWLQSTLDAPNSWKLTVF